MSNIYQAKTLQTRFALHQPVVSFSRCLWSRSLPQMKSSRDFVGRLTCRYCWHAPRFFKGVLRLCEPGTADLVAAEGARLADIVARTAVSEPSTAYFVAGNSL